MDAKPHRPTRSFAAQISRNENMPVNSIINSKQLDNQAVYPPHVNAGSFKAATKRSAFGDLSNTSHYPQQNAPANGISKVYLKMAPHKDNNKENAALADTVDKHGKAKTTFKLPPQRPANGARSMSNDNRVQAIVKEAVFKRTNIVYQDDQQQKPQTLSRKYTSQPHLKSSEAPVLRRAQSKHTMEGVSYDDDVDDDVIDVGYEDVVEGFRRQAAPASDSMNSSRPAGPCVTAGMEPVQLSPPSPPQQSFEEQEECWDADEDEEELYDEVGYTTAHSYKSYADNTTGLGLTTLLVPKRTAKVLAELEQARAYFEKHRSKADMLDDSKDLTLVHQYDEEIYTYIRALEERMIPNAKYMDEIQVDMTWSMRSILMDWVLQVHNRFNLCPETLFLTVNIIDRFLSQKIISLAKLQLVGATAIFIAAKYEEINCPNVQEIIFMVDNGYSREELLKAERFMLTLLDFELGCPGPYTFLRRISKADDYDLETRTLAKYFIEVTVMDERFVGCTGSYVAAGAHALARAMLRKGDWTIYHVYYSGYTWNQIKPLMAMILECCHMAVKHHSFVYQKYSDRRYKRSSIFVQEELANGFKLPFQNGIPRQSAYGPAAERTVQIRFPPFHHESSGMLVATQS